MGGLRSLFTGLPIGIARAAAGPAAAENVLRWASVGGALTFDPHAYDEIHTWAQFAQVYEPLVGFDSNLELVVEAYNSAQVELDKIVAEQKLNEQRLKIAHSNLGSAQGTISAAKSFAIVGHSNKYVDTFNIPIPVEVHPFARSFVLNELLSIGATPKLRMLDKGYPFVTENGNIIYETSFTSFQEMHEMEVKIKTIPGVMEVGIFTKCADAYYVINPNNTFTILNSYSSR